jgi:hypothetical protein
MAAKRGFRVRPLTLNARFLSAGPRRGRVAIALAAAATCLLAASPALADTGTVYVDDRGNAAAGGTLFNSVFGSEHDVGLGVSVLTNLETGSNDVAVGDGALHDNIFGNNDIAVGPNALAATEGDQNVGLGSQALVANTTGSDNLATGFQALSGNTIGSDNIAAGANALNDNQSGDENLALGRGALTNEALADDNIAIGLHTLFASTTGLSNTAVGDRALDSNTGGDENLALGANAGANLTTGDDNIDIANAGQAGETATIRIGSKGTQTRAFLQGVSGTSISGPSQRILINADGQLGTAKAAAHKPGGGSGAVARLTAQNRRQAARIAKLEREVGRLSHR